MIKTSIIGSTGYVGNELVRILRCHPQVKIASLHARSQNDTPHEQIYPNMKNLCDLKVNPITIEKLSQEVDVIFLALPHGVASNLISESIVENTKIIDLSADFRLEERKDYETWYKTCHGNSSLLSKAEYGLCEWNREKIRKTSLIANPGCYTTCSLLALLPLVCENIVDSSSIIIDAKSGVSGAGRSLHLGTHFCECHDSIKAYNIACHRHTPEIEQELSKKMGAQVSVNFTPHLIPMNRGILVTSYASLRSSIEYSEISEIYQKYYSSEYFVRLLSPNVFPETRWVKDSNFCDINFQIDSRTNRIIIVSALDNLMKGAAGQAVQNMNLLFDLEESEGINQIPIFP